MLDLSDVTLFTISTRSHYDNSQALRVLDHCNRLAKFRNTILFTNEQLSTDHQIIEIPKFNTTEDISVWGFTELSKYLSNFGNFVLQIHTDGYIINPHAWDTKFYDYDFIGSPWTWIKDYPVGNMGFYFASKNFFLAIQELNLKTVEECHPSDQILFNPYHFGNKRKEMESRIKIADYPIASKFSTECEPYAGSFGFHKYYNLPSVKYHDVHLLEEHKYMIDDPGLIHSANEVYQWCKNSCK